MKLKNYPVYQRPREKALLYGVETLSDTELLAIILRTGSKEKSVLELSQEIINYYQGFEHFNEATLASLTSFHGISKIKAIQILACVEIAKRLKQVRPGQIYIKEPQDGYHIVKDRFMNEKQEKVILLCLNSQLEVVKDKVMFIGGEDFSIISGKELFKEALMVSCQRIIIVHNHPSGDPHPSREDCEVTKKIEVMAKNLDMELVDHLIIGNEKFYSFQANKIFDMSDD